MGDFSTACRDNSGRFALGWKLRKACFAISCEVSGDRLLPKWLPTPGKGGGMKCTCAAAGGGPFFASACAARAPTRESWDNESPSIDVSSSDFPRPRWNAMVLVILASTLSDAVRGGDSFAADGSCIPASAAMALATGHNHPSQAGQMTH